MTVKRGAPPEAGFSKKQIFVMGSALLVFFLAMVFWVRHRQFSEAEWEARRQKIQALNEVKSSVAQEIKELVGDASCRTASDCRVAGLGPQTCGGYQAYLVYSMATLAGGRQAELLSKISEFNSAAEKASDLALSANPCGHPAGQVACVEGRCRMSGRR